jgi:hypothetical protein
MTLTDEQILKICRAMTADGVPCTLGNSKPYGYVGTDHRFRHVRNAAIERGEDLYVRRPIHIVRTAIKGIVEPKPEPAKAKQDLTEIEACIRDYQKAERRWRPARATSS